MSSHLPCADPAPPHWPTSQQQLLTDPSISTNLMAAMNKTAVLNLAIPPSEQRLAAAAKRVNDNIFAALSAVLAKLHQGPSGGNSSLESLLIAALYALVGPDGVLGTNLDNMGDGGTHIRSVATEVRGVLMGALATLIGRSAIPQKGKQEKEKEAGMAELQQEIVKWRSQVATLEAQLADKDDHLRGLRERAKYATIGFASYEDLEKLSTTDRERLKTELDQFVRSILAMQNENEWGNKIPSGLKSLMRSFSIRYVDSSNKVSTRMDIWGIRNNLRSLDEDGGLDVILCNRAFWSNRHQDCLLVVQALVTLRDLRSWLS